MRRAWRWARTGTPRRLRPPSSRWSRTPTSRRRSAPGRSRSAAARPRSSASTRGSRAGPPGCTRTAPACRPTTPRSCGSSRATPGAASPRSPTARTACPIDHVRFTGGVDPAHAEIGDYTSASSVGLHLAAIVAAQELGLISHEDALAKLRLELATLERLETHRGFHFNFYDTTSLERTSHFVSFVDAAWLAAGLMVVRQRAPRARARGHAPPRRARLRRVLGPAPPADVARLLRRCTRPLALSLRDALHRGARREPDRDRQGRRPRVALVPHAAHLSAGLRPGSRSRRRSGASKMVRGYETSGGWYEWNGLRYVPSWGGSMFEALMPTLFVDERTLAPKSLGRNAEVHVEVQRRWAPRGARLPGLGALARRRAGAGRLPRVRRDRARRRRRATARRR